MNRLMGRACGVLLLLAMQTGCVTGYRFAGWQVVGDNSWRQIAGELHSPVSGLKSMLVSAKRYDNFSLRVQFHPDKQVNSGVFLRCQDPAEITALNCYEVNIWDEHPRQEFRTGAIVTRSVPEAHVNTIGRWNDLVITANGEVVEVRINNVLTARLHSDEFKEGHLALQWGGLGSVRFRKFELRAY